MRDDIEYVNETNSKPRANKAVEILLYVFLFIAVFIFCVIFGLSNRYALYTFCYMATLFFTGKLNAGKKENAENMVSAFSFI